MIVKIGEVKSAAREERDSMRELIVSGLKLVGYEAEAPDWEHLLVEVLHLPVHDGSKRQWRRSLFSLKYKYRLISITPFQRGGERWGCYRLRPNKD